MLLGYVKLEYVEKLCGCYLPAKEDPSVFIDPIILDKA